MDPLQHIMVVTDAPTLTHDLLTWFPPDAYQVTTVATFAAATAHLQNQPDLVITQVKLGPYNGLHLALRARYQGIPAVVIGESDPVLERDAARFGATYVKPQELGREQVLSLAQHLIPPTSADPGSPDPLDAVSSLPAGDMRSWALDS